MARYNDCLLTHTPAVGEQIYEVGVLEAQEALKETPHSRIVRQRSWHW